MSFKKIVSTALGLVMVASVMSPAAVVNAAENYTLEVTGTGGNQWDGAQITAAAIGLAEGGEYTFSVDITYPSESGGLVLQTSAYQWIANTSSLVAGSSNPITLSGTVTMDAGEYLQIVKKGGDPNENSDMTFRADNFTVTDASGKVVYAENFEDGASDFIACGSAALTVTNSAPSVTAAIQPNTPAIIGEALAPIDFEDGTTQGFALRASEGTEAAADLSVAVSEVDAHTGFYSMLITGRKNQGDAPILDVTKYISSKTEYELSLWARIADESVPTTANITLSAEIMPVGSTTPTFKQFGSSQGTEISLEDGWVNIKGTWTSDAAFDSVRIYFETPWYSTTETDSPYAVQATASYYIDDVTLTPLAANNTAWDLTLPSISETYADDFLVGNVLEPTDIDDAAMMEMFKYHYNYATAENANKPINIWPDNADVPNFANADKIVDWALANGVKYHAHTLVWHNQSPTWVAGTVETPLTRAEAKANMEKYISTVAAYYENYKGGGSAAASWDVVNEAMANGGYTGSDWKENLRREGIGEDPGSAWWASYNNGADTSKGESGADYIYDAYKFAREYAPSATLYYNDFNEEIPQKRDYIISMISDINAQWKSDPDYDGRLLIEGMGLQSHYNSATSIEEVAEAFDLYEALGIKLSVSELDVTFPQTDGVMSTESQSEQAAFYAQLFNIYKEHADSIDRVTIWGKEDSRSWRYLGGSGARVGEGMPVLFDKLYAPKPAFYAVIDPSSVLDVTDDTGTADSIQTVVPTSTPFTIEVKGTPLNTAAVGVNKDGTLLPLRAVAESLGAKVTWNDATDTVTIVTLDGITHGLTIGQALPDDMGTAVIIDGYTMVLDKYITEQLGAVIVLDKVNNVIKIN